VNFINFCNLLKFADFYKFKNKRMKKLLKFDFPICENLQIFGGGVRLCQTGIFRDSQNLMLVSITPSRSTRFKCFQAQSDVIVTEGHPHSTIF